MAGPTKGAVGFGWPPVFKRPRLQRFRPLNLDARMNHAAARAFASATLHVLMCPMGLSEGERA
jgi:hypothetical protein